MAWLNQSRIVACANGPNSWKKNDHTFQDISHMQDCTRCIAWVLPGKESLSPSARYLFVKFETYKAIMWVMRAQTVKVFVWAKQRLLCKTVGLGRSEHFEALAQIVYPLTQILWPFVCPSAHCPGSATTSLKPNYGCKQTLKHSNHGI